jgi:hypothetical protein
MNLRAIPSCDRYMSTWRLGYRRPRTTVSKAALDTFSRSGYGLDIAVLTARFRQSSRDMVAFINYEMGLVEASFLF